MTIPKYYRNLSFKSSNKATIQPYILKSIFIFNHSGQRILREARIALTFVCLLRERIMRIFLNIGPFIEYGILTFGKSID